MSQENVEIAKRLMDAYNRRDVDAYVDCATPDFELVPVFVGAVEGGSYQGREGIERVFEATRDTWDDYRIVADEFRDLGDRVLMVGRAEGRGRVPIEDEPHHPAVAQAEQVRAEGPPISA